MISKNGCRMIAALIISSIVSLFLFFFIKNSIFAALLSCYIIIFTIFACDYKKNIMFLAFLVCFFVFLIGRPFAIEVLGNVKYSAISLNQESRNQMYICLLVSLISLAVGYAITTFFGSRKNSDESKGMSQSKVLIIRKVSKYAVFLAYLLVIIENIIRLVTVKQVGYTASYALEYDYSYLPFGLHNLVAIAPVAFAIFLATLPSKKEFAIPAVLFMSANIFFSLAGNRFEIVSCLLILIVYGVWRSAIDSEKWITAKHIILLIVAAPLMMIFLQNMSYWRMGVDADSDTDSITSFLYNIGGSSDLIGATDQFGEKILQPNVLYSFGGIWRGLNSNAVSQLIGVGNLYQRQTLAFAKNAHSLGGAITYYFYPSKYLSGYGLGNCYIAELYHDFSMPGVIIGNIIVGVILGLMVGMKKNRVLRNFFCVFFIMLMLRWPRDSFDYPLINLMNLKNILFIIIFVLIVGRLNRIQNNGHSIVDSNQILKGKIEV